MTNVLRPEPAPSIQDKLRRLGWEVVAATFFRFSPIPMHSWRSAILKAFGAKIYGPVFVYPTTSIRAPWNLELASGSCLGPNVNCYNVGMVSLAERALVSQGAHLCGASHDFRAADFALLVGDIRIGADAWIAADAFIGPGVEVGDGAVVGARSVVMRDVPRDTIFAGNPARQVGVRYAPTTD